MDTQCTQHTDIQCIHTIHACIVHDAIQTTQTNTHTQTHTLSTRMCTFYHHEQQHHMRISCMENIPTLKICEQPNTPVHRYTLALAKGRTARTTAQLMHTHILLWMCVV